MLSSQRSHRRPGGPELERHEHWRGQLLSSRGLNDHRDDEAERQHWHNRCLHDAYGVTLGLRVRPVPGEPAALTVGRGLAYDAYGRELLLTTSVLVPAPRATAEAARWTLLLRRAEPAGEGRVELAWRRQAEAALQDGVPLARGRWSGEGSRLVFEPDATFRPAPARALSRPHLAEGSTPAGKTAWRSWEEPIDPFTHNLPAMARGIEVTVSTATAGFTETPCYFAWLHGGPWQLAHQTAPSVLLDRVLEPQRDRFTFSLWDPATSVSPLESTEIINVARAAAELLELARERLYVCWLGVEPEPPTRLPGLSAHQIAIGKAGGHRPIRIAGGIARGPGFGPR